MHWRRKWQPTPVFLPGESQGQRSLVGCCLWGHTESDTTEVTQQQQQQQQEEGNGNPLQYSCLGNPTDRGAGGLWSKRSQKNRGGRREEGSGWETHVYLWRIHFDIWQN